MLGEATLAQDMATRLFDEGVYVSGFFFPVVPRGQARIRTQMNAALTKDELDRALAAFGKVGKESGGDLMRPNTMKALEKVQTGTGACGWFRLRCPRIGPDEVLIRVNKTGICGTDIHIWNWDDWAAAYGPHSNDYRS